MLLNKLRLLLLVMVAGVVSYSPLAMAKEPPIYTGTFSNKAVSGYDTVAYFTEGKAVKGNPNISTTYKGAVWLFASDADKDKFVANPEQYAPQYGGYCAWAVSNNDTASADPTKWKIVDGKLYLNYDGDIQKKWEMDIPGNIAKANKNWPGVINK
jgi:YHS domain-containing protein